MNDTTNLPQRTTNRSVSGINVVLGLWTIISPFVLAFGQYAVPMWNNVATGGAIVLCALFRVSSHQRQTGWSWINVILGAWLIISPFVLGFATMATPLWNNIIIGALTVIVAASSMAAANPKPRETAG